jgi:hypothetical protein
MKTEHDKVTISKGELDTPGNRNPECRYRGYKNEPLLPGATKDQQAAWDEGNKARAYSWAKGYITAEGDVTAWGDISVAGEFREVSQKPKG